jgi:hypothetical protein
MLGDFAGLPPLQLVVGSTEVLLDDLNAVARRTALRAGEWRSMMRIPPAPRAGAAGS